MQPKANTQSSIQVPSLYVGNLSRQVTQALLFELFSAVGVVTQAKIITDKLVCHFCQGQFSDTV